MEQVAFGPFVLNMGAARCRAVAHPCRSGALILAALAETPGRTVAKQDLPAGLPRPRAGRTVARIRAGQPAKDPARIEPALAGLRLAGRPEE